MVSASSTRSRPSWAVAPLSMEALQGATQENRVGKAVYWGQAVGGALHLRQKTTIGRLAAAEGLRFYDVSPALQQFLTGLQSRQGIGLSLSCSSTARWSRRKSPLCCPWAGGKTCALWAADISQRPERKLQ
ncbi:hypothetical protein GWK47_050403 [Chionoecetes opilio]|uniref:Uncharacterized protein n=1 Tax=Chionoecetes opilio TaxID=41210 RepID=A0A8J5CSW2_CHIOP|nr:hypothetical protein GWK47_050403 [Chionoecetes opilio]